MMGNLKTIFLYIVLVGIMFAGLLQILHIGEKIEAPVDVNGNWQIDYQFVKLFKTACVPIYFTHKDPEILIEQSGKQLVLSFNDYSKTKMIGTLEKDKMIFSQMLPVKQNLTDTCGKEALAELLLDIHQDKKKADQLSGIWRTPECGNCKGINFLTVKKE